jgi:5-(hydroxymethyl)furfural/furfural oxidase
MTVGPVRNLETIGVPVVVPLDGVGANLRNHPVLYLATHLRPEARQSRLLRPHFIAGLRFSSTDDPAYRSDMIMLVMNKSSWHGFGQTVAGLGVGLYQPRSAGPSSSPRQTRSYIRTSTSACSPTQPTYHASSPASS